MRIAATGGGTVRRLVERAMAAAVLALAVMIPAAAPAQAPAAFETEAEYAILIDAATGTVLFERNADALMAPASMAKLMTAEVVFHEIASGRLSLDDQFPISTYAWRTGGAPSRTSSMYAALNSRVSVRDLLRGAIIVSGNDACIALAEGIAGNEAAFAERMNRRARELGLTRSNFTNSTGLPDPNLRVTARELALLAAHIARTYPQFYAWYAEREFSWHTVRRPQQNRNPLLRDYPGADGLKTGYTEDSGYGLTGSAMRNGQRLILVVNGLETDRARAQEARRLLDWGYANFVNRQIFAANETVGEAQVFGGAVGRVPLAPTEDVRVLVPRNANPRDLRARVRYSGPIRAPITRGQEIGRLQIYNGQTLALDRPLVAAGDVAVGSLWQRSLDSAWELAVDIAQRGFRAALGGGGGAS